GRGPLPRNRRLPPTPGSSPAQERADREEDLALGRCSQRQAFAEEQNGRRADLRDEATRQARSISARPEAAARQQRRRACPTHRGARQKELPLRWQRGARAEPRYHTVDRRDLPRARGQPVRLHPTHAHRDSVAPSSAHRRADALALAPLRGIAVGTQVPPLFAPPHLGAPLYPSVAGASAPRRQPPSEALA